MWEKELEVCKEAAVLAGKAILDIYNNAEDMSVEYKDARPWSRPLTMNVQPAPCQMPLTRNTIRILVYARTAPLRLPPSGK